MSKKIIVLIITSIIGLIALSLIQGYLIKNTYSLKKEAFVEKAIKISDKIDDYATPVDSIYDIFSEKFIITLDSYASKEIKKEQLLARLHKLSDSLNTSFIKSYEKSVKNKKLTYNLKYHKLLKNMVVVDSLHRDTIFKENKKKPFKLFGHQFKSEPDLHVGNSMWESERTFTKETNNQEKKVTYKVLIQSEGFINIDNWNRIIFKEMQSLLVLSFLIFLFVIGTLYYSIKNLITQKKIADIKTDFVNNITHELKTPLATLSLATKILKKQEVVNQSDSAFNTIETIERQQLKLQKLIDQVLNNSLGYEEIYLEKEIVLLGDYLHTVLNDFELSITDEADIERIIPYPKEALFIDTFYMNTVLVNLLDNAIKYGGNKISVNAIIKHENIEITITDNGLGISKENQKLLFEKFFRVENKDIHNVKGLGLGLYYSNQIIKAHKGSLSIESQKEKGTSFIIKLPLK